MQFTMMKDLINYAIGLQSIVSNQIHSSCTMGLHFITFEVMGNKTNMTQRLTAADQNVHHLYDMDMW